MNPVTIKAAAWAVGIVVAALLAALVWQTLQLEAERGAHQKTIAGHATQVAEMERLARQAVTEARAEEQRRAAALEVAINETEDQLARARADNDAARDAGERLRNQIAAITARCRAATTGTGTAQAGPATGTTADLLADVQRRLDEAADGIAGFADRAHAAGSACERIYLEMKK